MTLSQRPTFRDLRVWQSALELAEVTYVETRALPEEERFGLTSQMRRCAVSVVANIAEGKSRHGARQFARFLDIAHGSLRELHALTILATQLGLLAPPARERLEAKLSPTIGQILNLRKTLARRTPPATS